jgi:hypothetical protein
MATMESPQEFTARATRMQYEAISLSRQISGDKHKTTAGSGHCT